MLLRILRALAETVSRWLPTAAARVCARSGHVVFVLDKVVLGQVFSEYLGFPCQPLFQLVADVPSVPSWTPPLFEFKKLID
jgi:hypothetical protein